LGVKKTKEDAERSPNSLAQEQPNWLSTPTFAPVGAPDRRRALGKENMNMGDDKSLALHNGFSK
jgi:hypothetical protein